MSLDRTEKLALFIRKVLGLSEDTWLDCLDVLRRLKAINVIFDFRPGTMAELGGAAAKWIQKTKTILIAPDLWDELEGSVNPEIRFTVFHEVGHAVMNHSDRNRNFGGAYQAGRFVESDEDEADRFAMALAMPMTIVNTTNVSDKKSLIRQFGLPEDKTELRMVDLQMQIRHPSEKVEAAIAEIDLFDAEYWLKTNAFKNKHLDRSVPTQDEDWDF